MDLSNAFRVSSNQPMIEKSLLRAITNLQDQAGCVVQVLVGFVDPEEGKLLVRKCVSPVAIFEFTAYLPIPLKVL